MSAVNVPTETVKAVLKAGTRTVSVLDQVLSDLASLDNPVESAAVVAFVLKVVPLDIPSTVLVGAVAGVGALSLAVKRIVDAVK